MSYGYALALAELESDLAQMFSWGGADYPCIIGARNESKELGQGGYALESGVEIVVRAGALPSAPVTNDLVTLNARSLQIYSVIHDPSGEFYVLICGDPTRGV